jgi:hypothetical protein
VSIPCVSIAASRSSSLIPDCPSVPPRLRS